MNTDDDDDEAPMPAHINSALAVRNEMELRRRKRERKAQVATVAGTILSEPIPPGSGMPRLQSAIDEERHLLEAKLTILQSYFKNRSAFAQTLSSVSSVAPSIQQTSIKNLEPLFKSFTDTEVSVYAMDEQPIGPRIGVPDVAEPTLKAIASFEVQRRGRNSDRRWGLIAGGLAIIIAGVAGWVVRGLLGG